MGLPPGTVTVPAPSSFFLSDAWIRACLDTWPGHARFDRIEAGGDGEARGYVLIGRNVETRHRVLNVPVAAINESANPFLDEVTLEMNGIIDGTPGGFESAFRHVLTTLGRDATWSELRTFGLMRERAERVAAIAAEHGLRCRLFRERPTYWVDLDAIRARHGGDYLASRSANAREQMRRSLRAAQRDLGPVRLVRAESAGEALRWLDELAPLHRARWPSRTQPTGFDNELFVTFHRNLISRSFESNVIDMLRVEAGDTTLAYLYNFRLDGHAYFYLSGIDYARAERYRPGLLAQWLAIDRSLAAGDRVYDLLAGEHAYKDRLATHQDLQRDLVLWRPRLSLRLEDTLRSLRRWWRARPGRSRPGD